MDLSSVRAIRLKRHRLLFLALLIATAATVVVLRVWRRPPPGPARLEALTRERDTLEDRWRDALVAAGETSLGEAPDADLVIGLPATLTRAIVGQVVTGVFGQATLTLTGLHVRKEGEVRTPRVLVRRTIGAYALDVDIHRVRGVLEAAAPALAFGDDRVDVTLPVRLVGGEGDAEIRLQWDSKGVTGVLCGDIDVTRTITGAVVPEDYEMAGSFAVAAEGDSIVLRPSFPDLAARIAVEPSAESWKVIEEIIRERPRGCEIALDAIDLRERLAGILGRGFNVQIPQRIFKAIPLPASVRRSVRVRGIALAMQVKPTAVVVRNDRLWYGSDVIVERAASARTRRSH